MNTIKKVIFKSGFEEELPPTGFIIDSTRVNEGTGTLSIIGGEPNETITLDFTMDSTGTFNSLSFSSPITVSVLDITHLHRIGTMLLDINGEGISTYLFDPLDATRGCLVTVTARSSGLPEGVGDDTNVV